MNITTFHYTEPPRCKICNKPMFTWNPWIDEHAHVECETQKIAESLIDNVMEQFKKFDDEKQKK